MMPHYLNVKLKADYHARKYARFTNNSCLVISSYIIVIIGLY
ncbi:hypothetical protein SOHN41_02854 [Shewanella sp. HN-41]|nr:hypothetical protein SOHN41_02854 [Shewanella sp. HN-41]